MADKYFSDWESLVKAIEVSAEKILKKYAAPAANDLLKKHIQEDIYNVYTPKPNAWVNGTTYMRRHVLENNIVINTSNISGGAELFITSSAAASPSVVRGYSFKNRYNGAFLKLLESDNLGIWKNGFPRPAVTNTQREFDEGNDIKEAILTGIRNEIGDSVIIQD